jgi:NTE family protein
MVRPGGKSLTEEVGDDRVETIFPDSNSEHMFGANAMDLSLRRPAAQAGYDQGSGLAEQLTEFWR